MALRSRAEKLMARRGSGGLVGAGLSHRHSGVRPACIGKPLFRRGYTRSGQSLVEVALMLPFLLLLLLGVIELLPGFFAGQVALSLSKPRQSANQADNEER